MKYKKLFTLDDPYQQAKIAKVEGDGDGIHEQVIILPSDILTRNEPLSLPAFHCGSNRLTFFMEIPDDGKQ